LNYKIFGQFPITRIGSLVSRTREHKREFWALVEQVQCGLSGACGCYIFILRNRAWYIGLAERQSFKNECFQHHKLTQYNEALNEVGGKPSLILVPKLTPGGRFAKPTERGHADIRLLENLLIGTALGRNPNIRNVSGTKLLREMNVPGFLNPRRGQARADIVQQFKLVLGV
jgi:hypothetical protein